MPAIAKERQEYHIAKIRSLIAEDHQITFEELQQRLDHRFGLKFDRAYVSRLAKKIFRERSVRADRKTLNLALAAFEDSMTQVVRVAWEIANDEFARKQDRVMALREVREAHTAIFDKLFDAGVFERKLGTLDATIRNTPLPEDRKQALSLVFANWGLVAPPDDTKTLPASNSAKEQAPKEDAAPTITGIQP